ncbi:GPN-loop GTPase 2 [Trichomonascus vanleenenianus]|uniref:GTPase GPN2 n=1 Tax=Trichomonascus vanleenenianus TaxID=2268995 RepID=UPI003ECB1A06
MPFGQLVIGPPGSGKSTYCNGMHQFLQAVGRKTSVINLDPANDRTGYPCALDIRDFTTLEDVMDEQGLGPNGGIMFAMEEVEASVDEFIEQVKKLGESEYLIFDCPGQVELFTHHSALQHIFKRLEKLDYRLVVIHLIDSFYITSPSQYVSIVLLALRSMLQLDLPHINVLSKIDLLKGYGELPFNLDYYTEVQDLNYLAPLIEKESPTTLGKKFARLSEAIADVIMDFGLVEFEVLAVEDKKSMISLLSVIDKANGYLFGATEVGGDTVWVEATRQGGYLGGIADIQERWIDHKEEYDVMEEEERRQVMGANEEPMTAEDEWEQALSNWEQTTGQRPLK